MNCRQHRSTECLCGEGHYFEGGAWSVSPRTLYSRSLAGHACMMGSRARMKVRIKASTTAMLESQATRSQAPSAGERGWLARRSIAVGPEGGKDGGWWEGP